VEAAETIASATRELANTRHGSQMTALDPILPQPEQYKGKPGGPPERVTAQDSPSLAAMPDR